MITCSNTRNLIKEADRLGSGYYLAMPKYNGEKIVFPARGMSYLKELDIKYGLANMIGVLHNDRLIITDYVGPGPFYYRMEFVDQVLDGIVNPVDRKFLRPIQRFSLTHPDQASTLYKGLLQELGKLDGLVITHENAPYVASEPNPHVVEFKI